MNAYIMNFIKSERIRMGLTQAALAQMIGVKNSTISNYEKGVSNPDMDTLMKLCEIFGVDYRDVLGEAFGTKVPGTDFQIRPSELKFIEQLRSLDEIGKEHINRVLSHEIKRLKEIKEAKSNNLALYAAHPTANPDAGDSDFVENDQEDMNKEWD